MLVVVTVVAVVRCLLVLFVDRCLLSFAIVCLLLLLVVTIGCYCWLLSAVAGLLLAVGAVCPSLLLLVCWSLLSVAYCLCRCCWLSFVVCWLLFGVVC